MAKLTLTEKDFKKTDNYWSEYIGKTDVSDYKGNITIEGDLGWVRFNSIKLSGYLIAEAGTGIEAGWGIEAGEGIKAGTGIKAGDGIEAGTGIKAGTGIEAGWGIVSGLSITCKLVLSFNYRLFAGITWFKNTDIEEKTITCGKLKGGTVCYGDVTETGLPDEPKETEKINIGGKDYEVTSELKDALKKLKEV